MTVLISLATNLCQKRDYHSSRWPVVYGDKAALNTEQREAALYFSGKRFLRFSYAVTLKAFGHPIVIYILDNVSSRVCSEEPPSHSQFIRRAEAKDHDGKIQSIPIKVTQSYQESYCVFWWVTVMGQSKKIQAMVTKLPHLSMINVQ